MRIEEQLKIYVDEALIGTSIFIVELKVLSQKKAIILLDGDLGIKIEDCAKVSRYINQKLEEDNLNDAIHSLEVSSPGVDYPLKFSRQYSQHIGRTLAMKLIDGSLLEGELQSITSDKISIEEKKKEKGKKLELVNREISFSEIQEAKISITFK